jgi:endonuclease G, mitochondrial
MTKNIKTTLWISISLVAGVVLGITSQRIPEIKSYTDDAIQPIERSSVFKELKIMTGYHGAVLTEPYPSSSENYTEETTSLAGHPISSFLIHRSGYSLSYDAKHRNPAWVYEHLTTEKVQGEANLLHSDIKEDESIPKHLRTSLADYRGRGVDLAQMAPAGDYQANQEILSDTFFLSNICPQCSKLNQGYWSKLEQHVRDFTKDYRNVYVITGPLYLPYNEGGVRFVKYRVVGPNDVAVPSHFFKVVILENEEGKKEMVAYVLPNYEIPLDFPLDNFRTSVQTVEKAAGILFPSG